MDVETRPSRRPLPRQLNVSDWNVDADVRQGVTSAARPRDRSPFDLGATVSSSIDRITRPTNRYDAGHSSAGWRTDAFSSDRISPSLQPPPPSSREIRASTTTWTSRRTSIEPASTSYRSASRLEPTVEPSIENGAASNGRFSSLLSEQSSARSSSRSTAPMPTAVPNTREQLLETPPRRPTERSADSTGDSTITLRSPSLVSSTPDTPSTISSTGRSPTPTPPRDRVERLDASTDGHSLLDEMTESNTTASEDSTALPPRSVTHERRPQVATIEPTSSVTATTTISPREQREQLYRFRYEMREVFARIDDMVDQHRDLFKCDPLSGLPSFHSTRATEAAAFANETFTQLTALRDRFQEMTSAWAATATPAQAVSERELSIDSPWSTDQRPRSLPRTPATATTQAIEEDAESTATSKDRSDGPLAPPSLSSESSTLQSRLQRWEPSLSSLSSSSSSDTIEPSLSGERERPPMSVVPSRSSASSPREHSSHSSRESVFEDFDRRMEEIRASLNAISRQRSTASSSTSSKHSSICKTPNIKSDREDVGRLLRHTSSRYVNENDPADGNRAARRGAAAASDHETRLRQLLRELRDAETDES